MSSRRWPAISATSTTSAPDRIRFVTQVWRSVCADSTSPASAASPRTTRSTARGLIRPPVRDNHNAGIGSTAPAAASWAVRATVHSSVAARQALLSGTSR